MRERKKNKPPEYTNRGKKNGRDVRKRFKHHHHVDNFTHHQTKKDSDNRVVKKKQKQRAKDQVQFKSSKNKPRLKSKTCLLKNTNNGH